MANAASEPSPEVLAQVDALLETIDLDPLGRLIADALWDEWEAEQAAEAEAAR
jgi:hypothetical protein